MICRRCWRQVRPESVIAHRRYECTPRTLEEADEADD